MRTTYADILCQFTEKNNRVRPVVPRPTPSHRVGQLSWTYISESRHKMWVIPDSSIRFLTRLEASEMTTLTT